MAAAKVSAIVLAQNEADQLQDCLNTLAWADERLVIDGFSVDGTPQLDLAGARLIQRHFTNFAEQRDALLDYCIDHGIEAKVHYPVPIYRQPALKYLSYNEGDFPVSDAHTTSVITFPCDQHLSQSELDYVVEVVREFYR